MTHGEDARVQLPRIDKFSGRFTLKFNWARRFFVLCHRKVGYWRKRIHTLKDFIIEPRIVGKKATAAAAKRSAALSLVIVICPMAFSLIRSENVSFASGRNEDRIVAYTFSVFATFT